MRIRISFIFFIFLLGIIPFTDAGIRIVGTSLLSQVNSTIIGGGSTGGNLTSEIANQTYARKNNTGDIFDSRLNCNNITGAGYDVCVGGGSSSNQSAIDLTNSYSLWWKNQTIDLTTSYATWWKNQTTDILNSYGIYMINQTGSLMPLIYNHTASIIAMYGQYFYNMSDGNDGGLTSEQVNSSISDYGVNIGFNSTYNETYDTYAYNETAFMLWNLSNGEIIPYTNGSLITVDLINNRVDIGDPVYNTGIFNVRGVSTFSGGIDMQNSGSLYRVPEIKGRQNSDWYFHDNTYTSGTGGSTHLQYLDDTVNTIYDAIRITANTGLILLIKDVSFNSRYYQDWGKLSKNSATPDMTASNLYYTQNSAPTNITTFTGGVDGQKELIFCNDAYTSITELDMGSGGNINLSITYGNHFQCNNIGDNIEFIYRGDYSSWYETGRSYV